MAERDHPKLSDREQQLLDLAAEGLTDTAIAHTLGISEATVNTYWGRVRIKLGPYNRTELVAKSLRRRSDELLSQLRAENQRLASRLSVVSGEYGFEGGNLYKDLLEGSADAIFLVSQSGVIQNLSDAAAQLFGYARDELIDEPVSRLIPERYRRIHDTHREAYVAQPERRRMGEHQATLAQCKDGREIPIAASLSAVTTGGQTAILCIVREVGRPA